MRDVPEPMDHLGCASAPVVGNSAGDLCPIRGSPPLIPSLLPSRPLPLIVHRAITSTKILSEPQRRSFIVEPPDSRRSFAIIGGRLLFQ